MKNKKINEKEVIDSLTDLSLEFDLNLSIELFGERLGNHIWRKYKEHKENFLELYRVLDAENRQIVVDYIKKKLIGWSRSSNRSL